MEKVTSQAKLKIVQLEPLLEPPWLRLIATNLGKKIYDFIYLVVVRVMVEVEPKNYQIFALNKMDVMDFGGWVQMPVLPIWWIQLQMF